MRPKLLVLSAILLALSLPTLAAVPPSPGAADQMPPGTNPETGARPGNEIGTGSSLPRSDRASHILPGAASTIAPNLPTPPIGENASSHDFLVAARGALAAGRTGEAQQALEMAETRRLDRSVPLFQTTAPISDPLAATIENALHALGAGDRDGAMRLIEQAIVMAPPGASPPPQ